MAVTEIIQFASQTSPDATQKALEALQGVKSPQHFVLGTQLQDKGAVQIVCEWDDIQSYTAFTTTPETTSFTRNLRSSLGSQHQVFHAALSRPALGLDGPATAPVVEFVQTYFPVSHATPAFQQQIEADFLKFESIYVKGVKGELGWTKGWVLEELEHEDIKDENARCFFVVRGWKSMRDFEESVKHEAYKESIPILLAWGAPFMMVSLLGCFRSFLGANQW